MLELRLEKTEAVTFTEPLSLTILNLQFSSTLSP
jgi:hypothetical protein